MELIALIVGVVALLVAVLSLFHRIWGAPKIVFTFEADDMENIHYLSCLIWNMPISKRLLNALQFRRELAQDVAAQFKICEQGTGKVICPPTPVKIRIQQGVMAERISLPASFFPARFAIVGFSKNNREVRVYKEQKQILPLGAYTAKVELFVGPKLRKAQCNFIVQDSFPFAYWAVEGRG